MFIYVLSSTFQRREREGGRRRGRRGRRGRERGVGDLNSDLIPSFIVYGVSVCMCEIGCGCGLMNQSTRVIGKKQGRKGSLGPLKGALSIGLDSH